MAPIQQVLAVSALTIAHCVAPTYAIKLNTKMFGWKSTPQGYNTKIFGRSIDDYEKVEGSHVPKVLFDLTNAILEDDTACRADGVFRISIGNDYKTTLLNAKSVIHMKKLRAGTDDTNAAHSLPVILKEWLKKLGHNKYKNNGVKEEPLIPIAVRNYYDVGGVRHIGHGHWAIIKAMKESNSMSDASLASLIFLIEFLNTVASYSADNRMPRSNIAKQFAPNIIICPPRADMMEELALVQDDIVFVESLMNEAADNTQVFEQVKGMINLPTSGPAADAAVQHMGRGSTSSDSMFNVVSRRISIPGRRGSAPAAPSASPDEEQRQHATRRRMPISMPQLALRRASLPSLMNRRNSTRASDTNAPAAAVAKPAAFNFRRGSAIPSHDDGKKKNVDSPTLSTASTLSADSVTGLEASPVERERYNFDKITGFESGWAFPTASASANGSEQKLINIRDLLDTWEELHPSRAPVKASAKHDVIYHGVGDDSDTIAILQLINEAAEKFPQEFQDKTILQFVGMAAEKLLKDRTNPEEFQANFLGDVLLPTYIHYKKMDDISSVLSTHKLKFWGRTPFKCLQHGYSNKAKKELMLKVVRSMNARLKEGAKQQAESEPEA